MAEKCLADRLLHQLELYVRRMKTHPQPSYLIKAFTLARWKAAREVLGVGPPHEVLVRNRASWLDFVDFEWGFDRDQEEAFKNGY